MHDKYYQLSKDRSLILQFKRGFTLVEIIVVISVIGILAVISILSYNGWRRSLVEAQLKSDLNGAASAMEDYRNFNDGYPSTLPGTFKQSNEDIVLAVSSIDGGKSYCVEATNSKFDENTTFNIQSKKGHQVINNGGCPLVAPLPPVIAASTTSGANTNWSWSESVCPAGATVGYQYRQKSTPTDIGSNWSPVNLGGATVETRVAGLTYKIEVQAKCSNPKSSSDWSESAINLDQDSYYRPFPRILVVGGGGGGAQPHDYVGGGGGGAGSFVTEQSNNILKEGQGVVSVTIGQGSRYSVGDRGGSSSFMTYTALGGGNGGLIAPYLAKSGGNGGGGRDNDFGVGTQGFNGGKSINAYIGGGGGGAGGVGMTNGGGGAGLMSDITGDNVCYSGGGSSITIPNNYNCGGGGAGIAGKPNTGGGGGDGGTLGGSGIVVISYSTGSVEATVTGATTTYKNNTTIHIFKNNGTINVTKVYKLN